MKIVLEIISIIICYVFSSIFISHALKALATNYEVNAPFKMWMIIVGGLLHFLVFYH